jgi:hypothetical protein
MRLGGIHRVRRADRDVRTDLDEGRAIGLRVGRSERLADRVEREVVAEPLDVPAVRLVARRDILHERQVGRALDRDLVVVVDQAELAEAEEAGDRGRLAGDALHHVAVGADREGAVIDDLVAGHVVARGQHALGDRHADGVADTLAERTGRDVDAGRVPPLGVAGRLRSPLPERLQVVHRQVVARQVERGILQHACVAGRQHEPVAVGPAGRLRVVPHRLGVEHVGDRRKRHGGTGMPGVRLLHGVHRETPNRVDREGLDTIIHGSQTMLLGSVMLATSALARTLVDDQRLTRSIPR